MNDANWPDLEAFLAVARTGSLAAGANRLRTSAPTLGRRVAALERQLRLQIFTKATAGYRLTEAGRQLLRHAEAVENTVLAFLRHRDGLLQDVTGEVRISAPETIVTHLLAPALPELRRRYPRLTLTFTTGHSLVDLPRRDADVAIRIGRPGEEELLARKIGDIRFRTYVPRGLKLAIKNVPDLKRLHWIGWGDDLSELAIAQTAHRIFDPALRVSSAGTMQLQVKLAKELRAALLAPDFVGGTDPKLVEAWGADVLVQPIWLVTSAEVRGAARIEAIVDWISKTIRGREAGAGSRHPAPARKRRR
jgi:DNA-binding transcriptional LysR family regulator